MKPVLLLLLAAGGLIIASTYMPYLYLTDTGLWHVKMADKYYRAGRTEPAIYHMQKAKSMNHRPEAHRLTLDIYLSNRQRGADLIIALFNNTNPDWYHYYMGRFHAHNEQHQKARRHFLKLNSTETLAWGQYHLALMEMREGDYAGAEAYIEQGLLLSEDTRLDSYLYAAKARLLKQQGRPSGFYYALSRLLNFQSDKKVRFDLYNTGNMTCIHC